MPPITNVLGRKVCPLHGVQLVRAYPGGEPDNGPAVEQCRACNRRDMAIHARSEGLHWSLCVSCHVPTMHCECALQREHWLGDSALWFAVHVTEQWADTTGVIPSAMALNDAVYNLCSYNDLFRYSKWASGMKAY